MPAARPAFSDEKTKYGVGTKKIVVKKERFSSSRDMTLFRVFSLLEAG